MFMNLKYKGSRNYLHGSDIYNAINESLSIKFGGHLSRLSFKRFARRHISLELTEPPTIDDFMGAGLWKDSSDNRIQFWLIETAAAVTDSLPFDEDSIIKAAKIDGETIFLQSSNEFSLIENIIALTKRLNYHLSPNVDGKWVFGRLDLDQALPNCWEDIAITRRIAVGNAFSRNSITVDDKLCGEIRFIGGRP